MFYLELFLGFFFSLIKGNYTFVYIYRYYPQQYTGTKKNYAQASK